MSNSSGLYNTAALLAFINAIVHFVGSAMSGFASAAMPVLVGGVVWLVFAIGLKAKQRWLAYFAFLMALIGGIFAYANSGAVVQWASMAIVGLDVLLALVLFVIIWRR